MTTQGSVIDVNTMTLTNEQNAPGPNQAALITLKIRTDADRRELLREMLPKFLRVVKPREDGLLDTLYSNYLLSDTDNESLSGKDVRTGTDQARKLWYIFNKVPLDEFMRKVAPELCALYPHIIPPRFVGHAELDDCAKCLRCAIQGRIRETSMADMLYHRNFLDLEKYGDIISGNAEARCAWLYIFSIFGGKSEAEAETLREGLVELLRRYNLHIPPDDKLKESVSLGLPCTCVNPVSCPPVAIPVIETKVVSWLRNSCPRSSGTSTTLMPPSTRSSGSTRKSVSGNRTPVPRAEAATGRLMACGTVSVTRDAGLPAAVVAVASVGGLSVNVETNRVEATGARSNNKSFVGTFINKMSDLVAVHFPLVFEYPHFFSSVLIVVLIVLWLFQMLANSVAFNALSDRIFSTAAGVEYTYCILREHSLIPPQSNLTKESFPYNLTTDSSSNCTI